MKKLTKSILCLALALCLILSLAACGNKNTDETTKKSQDEVVDTPSLKDAEKVVENFMNVVVAFDLDKLDKYTTDNFDTSSFSNLDFSSLITTTVEDMLNAEGITLNAEQSKRLSSIGDNFTNIFSGNTSYKIVNSELVDDLTAVVEIEYSVPDYENMSSLDNYLSWFEDPNYSSTLLEKIINKYGYTMENVKQNASEDELEAMYAEYLESSTDYILTVYELCVDAMSSSDVPIKTDNYKITVVYEDGEWLVDEEEIIS